MLGGEDFKLATTKEAAAAQKELDPNYNPLDPTFVATGSGGYLNDVWWTSGANWTVFTDFRARGAHGEPLPRIVSRTTWQRSSVPGLPPAGMSYREWLCCYQLRQRANETLWPCVDAVLCEAGDPFAGQRRWSPRRGHAAVTVDTARGAVVLVLGGRARALEDMPQEETLGGLLADRMEEQYRWLEKSILMSDVWATVDGHGWELINPGCYVPSLDHTKRPGTLTQQCSTDRDCWMRRLGNTHCFEGMCVCKHWSPRERFSAASFGGRVYVAGGVTYVQRNLCGTYACGNEVAQHLNDVWASDDLGNAWTQIVAAAQWAPRADFALVYAGGLMWVLGGRSGIPSDSGYNPLYNDVWASTLGEDWFQNTTGAAWSKRAGHVVAVDGERGRLFMLGGVEEVELPPPPPPDDPATAADAAAANVRTNIYHEPSVVVPPVYEGEMVNGMQVKPLEEAWQIDITDVSAEAGEYGGLKNVWLPDFNEWQFQVRLLLQYAPCTARLGQASVAFARVASSTARQPRSVTRWLRVPFFFHAARVL